MPLGSDGKIPAGLLIPLLNCSQKQRGHFFKSERLDGENL